MRSLEEVVVVLEAELGKLREEPSEVGGETPAALALGIVRVRRVFHMQVVAAKAGAPAGLKTPDDLGVGTPVVKGLGNREGVVQSTPCFEAAVHGLRLPL